MIITCLYPILGGGGGGNNCGTISIMAPPPPPPAPPLKFKLMPVCDGELILNLSIYQRVIALRSVQ